MCYPADVVVRDCIGKILVALCMNNPDEYTRMDGAFAAIKLNDLLMAQFKAHPAVAKEKP